MKRRLCSAILLLEAVVLGLSTPVLVHDDDLSNAQGLVIGLSLCVLCFLTAGLLRMRWAYWIGWLIQGCALALAVFTPVMIALGLIFGALWVAAYRLGTMIDTDRAAAGTS